MTNVDVADRCVVSLTLMKWPSLSDLAISISDCAGPAADFLGDANRSADRCQGLPSEADAQIEVAVAAACVVQRIAAHVAAVPARQDNLGIPGNRK